jgi:hypothetical protein
MKVKVAKTIVEEVEIDFPLYCSYDVENGSWTSETRVKVSLWDKKGGIFQVLSVTQGWNDVQGYRIELQLTHNIGEYIRYNKITADSWYSSYAEVLKALS